MLTRTPCFLLLILLMGSSLVNALEVTWKVRHSQTEYIIRMQFFNDNNHRSIQFNVPLDIPKDTGLVQNGPCFKEQHQDLLRLMLRALGQQINANENLGPAPPLAANLPITFDIFPLHWLSALPPREPVILDQLHFLPHTVYVNLGHHHSNSTQPNSFSAGVILHHSTNGFHLIVTNTSLDEENVNGITGAILQGSQQIDSLNPFFYTLLSSEAIATLTGESVPSNWPNNLIIPQLLFNLAPNSESDSELQPFLIQEPETFNLAMTVRALLIVFCCCCCRAAR